MMAPDIEYHIEDLHSGQFAVAESSARFRVLNCGRRWGKTRLAVGLGIASSLRGQRGWWVAPSYQLASVGWRALKHYALAIPGAEIRLGDRQINMPGGGWVQVRTGMGVGGLRGDGLDFVIFDECAQGKEESWTEELRPALSDRKGWALFPSTPKGRANWFYRLWLRGQGDDPDWQSWSFPTSANPHIDPAEIESAREYLPVAVFDQEFLAKFNDAGASPFRPEDIDAMAAGWFGLLPPSPNRRYVTAWDIGRRNDATVGITIDTTDVPYQVTAFDRAVQMPYPAQQAMINERHDEYPGRHVVESNGVGDPVIENLSVRVEPFVTSARSKTQALQSLQQLLERGAIKCDVPDIMRELRAYEWDDRAIVQDCVMSLAIAALHCPPVGKAELVGIGGGRDEGRPHGANNEFGGIRSATW